MEKPNHLSNNNMQQAFTFEYTVEEGLSFKHDYVIKGVEVDKFRHELKIYNFYERNNSLKKNQIVNVEHVKVLLTQTLNKLTFKEFDFCLTEMDRVCKCSEFVDLLITKITEMALSQWNFAPLYAMFLQKLIQRYPCGKDLQNVIIKMCIDKSNDTFTSSWSLFIGFLGYLGIVPINQIFKILVSKYNEQTNSSLDTIYNISISCGKIFDLYLNGKEFYNNLGNFSKSYSSRYKFMIMDLLEARENNWDTYKLLPKEYCQQNILKIKDNSFIYDIEKILHDFIHEKLIFIDWSKEMLCKLMITLTKKSETDYLMNFKFIEELKFQHFLNKENVIQVITDTYEIMSNSDDHFNKERFGSLIMKLIILELYEFQEFGKSIPYDHLILYGFLKEAIDSGNDYLVSKSQWMNEGNFLPKLYSYLDICNALDNSGFIGLLPLYDDMCSIYYYVKESKDNLKNMIDEEFFEESLYKSTTFIEFMTELLVIMKPIKYKFLYNYISNDMIHALDFIEKIGGYYKWTTENTVKEIKEIVKLLNYDLSKWILNSEINDDNHKEIIKCLKN